MGETLPADLPSQCDLLVIGGGVNGLGVALDAAGRGLSVALVEKDDWGCGATAASSRLIHGGLRYLRHGEVNLVRESLAERGLLVRQRPHLVKPIDLHIPCFRGLGPPPLLLQLALRLYHELARDPDFPAPRKLSRRQMTELEPGLTRDGLQCAFVYPDAQIAWPERLCAELAVEAAGLGAALRNHCAALELLRDGGEATGARWRDTLTGEVGKVRARLTINAAGPWVETVVRGLTPPPHPILSPTAGIHLVLPRREEAPRSHLHTVARADRRPIFILPWNEALLVGATDTPFRGDPDNLRVEESWVEYLLTQVNQLFPAARYGREEILWITAGVRPLARGGGSGGSLSRRSFIRDHGATDGVMNLWSIGGKLTTWRSLAEDVVDRAAAQLGLEKGACLTRAVEYAHPPPLPAPARLAQNYSRAAVDWMCSRIEREPALGEPLCTGAEALAVEAVHALEVEGARTPDDVILRRLGLIPPPASARDALMEICRTHSLPLHTEQVGARGPLAV